MSSWFWGVFAKWAGFKIPKLSNWQISELLADQWTFIGKNGEVLPVLQTEKFTKSSLGQPWSFFAHFSSKITHFLYNTRLWKLFFLVQCLKDVFCQSNPTPTWIHRLMLTPVYKEGSWAKRLLQTSKMQICCTATRSSSSNSNSNLWWALMELSTQQQQQCRTHYISHSASKQASAAYLRFIWPQTRYAMALAGRQADRHMWSRWKFVRKDFQCLWW